MNKLGTKLGAIAMSAVMALGFAPSTVITTLAAGSESTDLAEAIYRVYNPNSGEHLFTTNHEEVLTCIGAGWEEGDVAWYAPKSGDAVYRLFNPNHPLGDHHYTADKAEADWLVGQGWNNEGVKFYSAQKDGLDRDEIISLYNPNAYAAGLATHHLTLDTAEVSWLVGQGWTNEGVKFYGYAEDPDEPVVGQLTVSIDNETPKVGDTLNAIVLGGAGTVTYQWLADGVAIDGATEATLKVTSDMAGKKISVTVTDEEGNVATSDPTKVVSNVSAEITIADSSGLQEDGTGLVGDLLTLSYGSELGVPKTITWYYNEKVVKAWDSNGGQLDQALALQTGNPGDYNGLLKDGE